MAARGGAGASRQASSRTASASPPGERKPRLVLASGSPQRRAILGDLGLDFDVRASDVAEEDEGAPRVVASENALRKALAVAAGARDDVVIGCDTLVATDGVDIWGKPADEAAARATLRHLSGRTHEVVSGLAVVQHGDVRAATEITEVTFRDLDDRTIEWYISTGEWNGRAGGYAIQGRGAVLVKRVVGDYLNVVGLPVAALLELFPGLVEEFGGS
ncbi:MAG TPA: Maf family protein [Baekduia sp.]|uniref:Maf family protein n=1 Tax=Baekduia sp. TaxID=2600305 RepID=UPI002D79B667|nr:Maf family protein [Baekduia sp.]HET6508198.1 Maf family protein [Baekduia sp.]